MKEVREVYVEGKVYPVTISDEKEALLAAAAAGRAIIGLWDKSGKDLSSARFLVESLEDVTPLYLEQVVRRNLGLPWIIAETDRLVIREFRLSDAGFVRKEEMDTQADAVFYTPEKLEHYIRCQYGFYGYGIWTLIERCSGTLIGMAGVVNAACWEGGEPEDKVPEGSEPEDKAPERGVSKQNEPECDVPALELGYHIFKPYRRKGYAKEACQAILRYVDSQLGPCVVYAKIDASNEASIGVARSCGFRLMERRCNEESRYMHRYVQYLL